MSNNKDKFIFKALSSKELEVIPPKNGGKSRSMKIGVNTNSQDGTKKLVFKCEVEGVEFTVLSFTSKQLHAVTSELVDIFKNKKADIEDVKAHENSPVKSTSPSVREKELEGQLALMQQQLAALTAQMSKKK